MFVLTIFCPVGQSYLSMETVQRLFPTIPRFQFPELQPLRQLNKGLSREDWFNLSHRVLEGLLPHCNYKNYI